MFDESFFGFNKIVVEKMDGRYRLCYEGTGKLFLNFKGIPEDGGGYGIENQAISQAKWLNTRLQDIRKVGGIKPGISNERAVAWVLWLDGTAQVPDWNTHLDGHYPPSSAISNKKERPAPGTNREIG
ncbi:MAG: hypothetical protein HQL88_09035 [Magnetococcales bacterium]|nr:hypothetical protein [Magnetococcales bacterium]